MPQYIVQERQPDGQRTLYFVNAASRARALSAVVEPRFTVVAAADDPMLAFLAGKEGAEEIDTESGEQSEVDVTGSPLADVQGLTNEEQGDDSPILPAD